MGLAIDRTDFSARDHANFARKLQQNLDALKILLAQPGFLRSAAFQPRLCGQQRGGEQGEGENRQADADHARRSQGAHGFRDDQSIEPHEFPSVLPSWPKW